MEQNELYLELRDSIFNYCGKHFWRNQKMNDIESGSWANSDSANLSMYKVLTQGGALLENKNIGYLTNDGFEAYKFRIVEKIFKEYMSELELNLCPKCSKIARTPFAKQCQFCFYSWH